MILNWHAHVSSPEEIAGSIQCWDDYADEIEQAQGGRCVSLNARRC